MTIQKKIESLEKYLTGQKKNLGYQKKHFTAQILQAKKNLQTKKIFNWLKVAEVFIVLKFVLKYLWQ